MSNLVFIQMTSSRFLKISRLGVFIRSCGSLFQLSIHLAGKAFNLTDFLHLGLLSLSVCPLVVLVLKLTNFVTSMSSMP